MSNLLTLPDEGLYRIMTGGRSSSSISDIMTSLNPWIRISRKTYRIVDDLILSLFFLQVIPNDAANLLQPKSLKERKAILVRIVQGLPLTSSNYPSPMNPILDVKAKSTLRSLWQESLSFSPLIKGQKRFELLPVKRIGNLDDSEYEHAFSRKNGDLILFRIIDKGTVLQCIEEEGEPESLDLEGTLTPSLGDCHPCIGYSGKEWVALESKRAIHLYSWSLQVKIKEIPIEGKIRQIQIENDSLFVLEERPGRVFLQICNLNNLEEPPKTLTLPEKVVSFFITPSYLFLYQDDTYRDKGRFLYVLSRDSLVLSSSACRIEASMKKIAVRGDQLLTASFEGNELLLTTIAWTGESFTTSMRRCPFKSERFIEILKVHVSEDRVFLQLKCGSEQIALAVCPLVEKAGEEIQWFSEEIKWDSVRAINGTPLSQIVATPLKVHHLLPLKRYDRGDIPRTSIYTLQAKWATSSSPTS